MDVDTLYRRYGPMVMRRCRQLLRDEDQALDATQDVFVRLLTRRDRLRDDACLLYTSPSPRDGLLSRMPSSA